jgi:hypothetical protein
MSDSEEEANADRRPCPVCGEMIMKTAKVCRHCGETFKKKSEEGDATGGVIPYKNPPALIAYYCGLFSLLACIPIFIFLPLPIVALVCGIKGLKKAKEEPHVRGQVHAWIGVVLGIICGLIGLVGSIFMAIVYLNAPRGRF